MEDNINSNIKHSKCSNIISQTKQNLKIMAHKLVNFCLVHFCFVKMNVKYLAAIFKAVYLDSAVILFLILMGGYCDMHV
jgi:hypothetical protein